MTVVYGFHNREMGDIRMSLAVSHAIRTHLRYEFRSCTKRGPIKFIFLIV